MKPLARLFGAALMGAFALLATPAAQAQVGVNINIGVPAWGPQVPYGTQYYYIPEIDGYYDLYSQQYIVFQDGYWVPQPQLYGYDPYQFHPVIVDYRGAQPWSRVAYYRQRYAYQPYRNYGPSRGYYNGGYGYGPSYGRPRYDHRSGYSNGSNYYGGRDNRNQYQYPGSGRDNRNPGNNGPARGNQGPGYSPQGSPGQGPQGGGRGNDNGGGRGNSSGGGRGNDDGGGRSTGRGRT